MPMFYNLEAPHVLKFHSNGKTYLLPQVVEIDNRTGTIN